ncbi:hypothetical protein HYV84_03165 [Candidatus Woesearchaeota archaeon]|nr:hypothetical protein [Candidatus Woesearchaeota archaeon]
MPERNPTPFLKLTPDLVQKIGEAIQELTSAAAGLKYQGFEMEKQMGAQGVNSAVSHYSGVCREEYKKVKDALRILQKVFGDYHPENPIPEPQPLEGDKPEPEPVQDYYQL